MNLIKFIGLISIFNRLKQSMKNIDKLKDSLLREELHNMLLELGIIHMSEEPDDESVVQMKIKTVGFNKEMFESALYIFKTTSLKAFEDLI